MTWESIAGIGLGSMFLIRVIENSRMQRLVTEAQKIREMTQKPILLISSTPKKGFDVHIDPIKNIAWKLPYTNKAFAVIVANCLEDMPYPQQAVAEWTRVADKVLVTSHLFFSPETWLDLRHKYAYVGNKTISINPALTWGVIGGLGYYFYTRSKKKTQALSEGEKAKPALTEGKTLPKEKAVALEEGAVELDSAEEQGSKGAGEHGSKKAHLPICPPALSEEVREEDIPEMDDVKIETAPLVKPGKNKKSPTLPKGSSIPLPTPDPSREGKLHRTRGKKANIISGKIEKEIGETTGGDGKDKDMLDEIAWQRGTVNLNIGDIIPNITTQLGMKGVTNLTFDPVKMPEGHNKNVMAKFEKKPADTVTLNLLDYIPDKEERLAAIQVAQENVKMGGEVYIDVADTKKYMTEINEFFPDAEIRDGYVVGVKRRS
jgi:hypothetical protein